MSGNDCHYDAVHLSRRAMPEQESPEASKYSPNTPPEAGPGSDHYTAHAITPLEYVRGMGRNEHRGACVLNVIKYVTRFHLKGTPMMDLKKARWYVDQLIEAQEKCDAHDAAKME